MAKRREVTTKAYQGFGLRVHDSETRAAKG